MARPKEQPITSVELTFRSGDKSHAFLVPLFAAIQFLAENVHYAVSRESVVIPGADLEVDIVPEGSDPLGRAS